MRPANGQARNTRVKARPDAPLSVRAFLCALMAARFWGDPRPILHTGQLPAADPTLDGYVLGGESMAARSRAFALPWFARSDYPALLDLFSDSDLLPATYDAWLERAQGVERQFQKAGFDISKIWIRPIPFVAWCNERNISPDQVARLTFVNEAVRDLLESRRH
jgi:hypothetical protein